MDDLTEREKLIYKAGTFEAKANVAAFWDIDDDTDTAPFLRKHGQELLKEAAALPALEIAPLKWSSDSHKAMSGALGVHFVAPFIETYSAKGEANLNPNWHKVRVELQGAHINALVVPEKIRGDEDKIKEWCETIWQTYAQNVVKQLSGAEDYQPFMEKLFTLEKIKIKRKRGYG